MDTLFVLLCSSLRWLQSALAAFALPLCLRNVFGIGILRIARNLECARERHLRARKRT